MYSKLYFLKQDLFHFFDAKPNVLRNFIFLIIFLYYFVDGVFLGNVSYFTFIFLGITVWHFAWTIDFGGPVYRYEEKLRNSICILQYMYKLENILSDINDDCLLNQYEKDKLINTLNNIIARMKSNYLVLRYYDYYSHYYSDYMIYFDEDITMQVCLRKIVFYSDNDLFISDSERQYFFNLYKKLV